MRREAMHPIIYVRGYAMTQSEIEDTVADPYMGFNIGSSKLRQLWTGKVEKYYFESPLVRLLKHFEYHDVYKEGRDLVSGGQFGLNGSNEEDALPYRSVVIYRYYEPSSEDLGSGAKPDMGRFARGLCQLISDLRDRIYPAGPQTVLTDKDRELGKPPYEGFRVYLVAHSMGGLVCRAFLQNPSFCENTEIRGLVDKLFTYATPHNGIEIGGVGNVPDWLTIYGINTFNRDEIARLLRLTRSQRPGDDVDVVTNFDASRVFNLVGSNPIDYKVAAGLSSLAVGDASDGLVRIKNATTRGMLNPQRGSKRFFQSPQAFVHRSHSGYYGIVNSEEGYQNLVRFLFGDMRVDGYLDIDELTLPPEVEKQRSAGKEVKASYLFEVAVSIRGKSWQLHRRTVDNNSAIFSKFDVLFPSRDVKTGRWIPDRQASPMLFNAFIDMDQSQTGDSFAFSIDLRVKATDYQVEGFLFLKDHYEGSYIYRDMLTIEAKPPGVSPDWEITYQLDSERDQPPKRLSIVLEDGVAKVRIPIKQPTPPGIDANLRIEASLWNN